MQPDPIDSPAPPPADLAHLAAGVDKELELAAPGAAEAAAAAAPQLSLEQELAAMFELAGAGAGAWLPSVGAVLNADNAKKLGDALAPVLNKYGLARFFVGFAWRVELQAVMVAVPIALAVKAAAVHDLAQLRARAAAAAAGEAAPPIGAAPIAAASVPTVAPQDYRGQLEPVAA